MFIFPHILRAKAVFAALAVMVLVPATKAFAEPPILLGVWQGEATVLLQYKGKTEMTIQRQELEITQQDGNLIRGIHRWMASDSKIRGNVSGQPVEEAREPFLGVIGQSGKTLRMVETDDRGMLFGTLHGPNEFEVEYFEAGTHAIVWNAILRRKPR